MVRSIKKNLYFIVAAYFKFWASLRLSRWNPRVVVVTGSNGKTSTLHLIESQLGGSARYSHHANSAFGIPFDILGLKRVSFSKPEWIALALAAPFKAFKKPYPQNIYVAEADSERPGEGKFLSGLLKPEVLVWLNLARTHSQNFEASKDVDTAIAREFGWFAERTTGLVIYNLDQPLLASQIKRTEAKAVGLRLGQLLSAYALTENGTRFGMDGTSYEVPFLLPREMAYSLQAAFRVADYFGHKTDPAFKNLVLPPGRSSLFKGIKNTTIVDSSYNANLDSVEAILGMVAMLPAKKKWLILGDLIEQGSQEQEEHEKLGRSIAKDGFDRIVFVGPRLTRYTQPLLSGSVAFDGPKEALDYMLGSLQGEELLVFKGARFLEGIIEGLLADKKDVAKLCRREPVWQRRRREWGLS